MSDEAERFYELRDDVSREAQMFAEAASRPLPTSATDESQVIEVRLAEDGPLEVTIADRWRDAYEPAELANGVLRTFQQLSAARTAGWVSNLEGSLDEERRNTPVPPLDDSVASKLHRALEGDENIAAEVTKVLENVLSFLDDVSANFDATFDDAVRRGRATHRVAQSPDLSVEVTSGGDLQSITFSEEWASRSSGTHISRELNAAIARSRAETESSSKPLDGTPLAKYQRFVDDPDSFVGFVRGKE